MRLVYRAPMPSHAGWLPRLVKRLEVEHIYAPIQSPTDRRRPERLGARDARHRALVLVPSSWPSRLANPQLRGLGRGPGNLLDMSKCLHDVIEEGRCGIRDRLALPVTEGIAEQDVRAASDQRVGAAVLVLIPGVRGADLEFVVGGLLDLVDLVHELRPCGVAPVERL